MVTRDTSDSHSCPANTLLSYFQQLQALKNCAFEHLQHGDALEHKKLEYQTFTIFLGGAPPRFYKLLLHLSPRSHDGSFFFQNNSKIVKIFLDCLPNPLYNGNTFGFLSRGMLIETDINSRKLYFRILNAHKCTHFIVYQSPSSFFGTTFSFIPSNASFATSSFFSASSTAMVLSFPAVSFRSSTFS